jgi:hypothetical protein
MTSLVGYFVVARPVLDDKNFTRSVVLILQHGPEGAFGLVVNRPFKTEKLPFPIYLGGPCKLEGMLLLHGHAEWMDHVRGYSVARERCTIHHQNASLRSKKISAARECTLDADAVAGSELGDRVDEAAAGEGNDENHRHGRSDDPSIIGEPTPQPTQRRLHGVVL